MKAIIPDFGSVATPFRVELRRIVWGMGKKQETRTLTLKQILAKNVQDLLDRDFPGRRGQHTRFRKQHSAFPLSKIQRAVKDGSINLETLEELAGIFNLEPYQMLIPGLNVREAQVAVDVKQVNAIMEMSRKLVGSHDEDHAKGKAITGDDAQARPQSA